MNAENRNKVTAYINKHGGNVGIRFGIKLYQDYYNNSVSTRSSRIKELKKLKADGGTMKLRDVVIEVINLSQWFGTRYVKISKQQCRANARRTLIDIWRLVNYYTGTEVDIFEVMHILYNLLHSGRNIVTSYCSMVKRRTFRFDESRAIYDKRLRDEFKLLFSDWRYI